MLLAVFFPLERFQHPVWFVTLLLLSSTTSAFKVTLPLARSGSTMSVSYAVDFLSLLLLGPAQTMIVGAISAWSQCTFRMHDEESAVPHAVQHGEPRHQRAGGRLGVSRARRHSGPRVDAACGDGQAAARRGRRLLRLQHGADRDGDRACRRTRSLLQGLERELPVERAELLRRRAVAAAGVSIVIGGTTNYWIALLAAPPLYLTYRSYKIYLGRIEDEQRHVQEVSDLHLATIEALALAIDAKDRTGKSHIRRVQVFAAGLAQALGMPENEIQGVKTAALLHDIGKLAVPEHILSKPGPLTQEEFQKIRIHPQVGAEIIAGVPFPYPVAPLILSHHERWDGKGYPAGMKGDEIPLGARILAVVDYFDALTSERPYHKAMSDEGAVGPAAAGSRQGARPAPGADVRREPRRSCAPRPRRQPSTVRTLALPTGTSEKGRPAVGLLPEPSNKTVFDDIALAHREIYALYEIAQAMGTSLGVADTMALISSKLSNLVPFSCCALFLLQRRARNAALPVRDRHRRRSHPADLREERARADRLGGAQPPPLVNARPSADLEAAGISAHDVAAVGAGLPAGVQRAVHRHAVGLPHRRGLLHRRPPPAARSRVRAGRGGHLQLDRVRADAGRLADRSADRAAEHALHVHAPHARAGARRAPEVGGVAARHGPRQLQGDQRQPRPPRRRPRAARSGGRAARGHPARTTSASATPATSSSSCCRAAARRRPSGSGVELQTAIDDVVFEARPGKRLQLGISIGAAVFPHDGDTLRDAAGHGRQPDVPRQDEAQAHAGHQARRSRYRSSRREPSKAISDSELERAASGVL